MCDEDLDIYIAEEIDLNDITETWKVKVNMLGEIIITNDKKETISETNDISEALESIEDKLNEMLNL